MPRKAPTVAPVAPAATIALVPLADLQPHPQNYRVHPPDQQEHLQQSIGEHGIYRNVVVARGGIILAGHGVVEAARALGYTHIPARQLDLDAEDPKALQVLIGDNAIAHLAEEDDRALTELLKSLHTLDPTALLGTGYDASMVAALAYVTRPASEIADKDEAAHWVGMPSYEEPPETVKLILSFRSAADRQACLASLGLPAQDQDRLTLSAWWPEKRWEDTAALQFEG